MIALFLILVVVLGAMLFGGAMLALSIVFRVALGLLLLPFRLVGAILYLPFLILRGLIGGVIGLAMLPLALVGVPLMLAGSIVMIVLFSIVTPLLPILAIGAAIWLLVKASARPTVI
jgi:hypothetical protein